MAVLDESEAALRTKLQDLGYQRDAIAAQLNTLTELRKRMLALPKRTSRGKNRVAPAANAQPTATTTVA